MNQSGASSGSSPVLLLNHARAEWFERGPDGVVHYGSAPVEGSEIRDFVTAAEQARRTAGGRCGAICTLALGDHLLQQRAMTLPPISRKDLPGVLLRKAAGLLEAEPELTLFGSLPMGPTTAATTEPSGDEGKWLLVAQERGFAVGLRAELERSKIGIGRVVSSRLARLDWVQAARGDTSEACIVLDVGATAAVVSLLEGAVLHQQTRLEGSFEATPTMALMLVQEVRTFDSLWRRETRGGEVRQVFVLGIESDQCALLSSAIHNAVPSATFIDGTSASDRAEPVAPQPDALESVTRARLTSLEACGARGPFEVNLKVHVPHRRAHVAAFVSCFLLVAVGLASWIHGELGRRLLALQEDARAASVSERELTVARQRVARDELTLLEAQEALDRLTYAGSLGIPLRACLEDSLRALGPHAGLLSLSLAGDHDGGDMTLTAETHSDPLLAMQVLAAVERRLQGSEQFEAIVVEAPDVSNGDNGEAGTLHFEVHGRRWMATEDGDPSAERDGGGA